MEPDTRLKKDTDTGRGSRGAEDRQVTENRQVTEDDRLQMFRQQLFNDALPDLPNIPGYHVCWLTTTNPRDSIHRRMRLGYEPIKAEDAPGLEYTSVKTGEWQGFVAVNEMLAFKLPLSLYEKFMQEAHHDAPAREEGKLRATTDLLREQAARAGGHLEVGDGMEELGRNPARGVFDD